MKTEGILAVVEVAEEEEVDVRDVDWEGELELLPIVAEELVREVDEEDGEDDVEEEAELVEDEEVEVVVVIVVAACLTAK